MKRLVRLFSFVFLFSFMSVAYTASSFTIDCPEEITCTAGESVQFRCRLNSVSETATEDLSLMLDAWYASDPEQESVGGCSFLSINDYRPEEDTDYFWIESLKNGESLDILCSFRLPEQQKNIQDFKVSITLSDNEYNELISGCFTVHSLPLKSTAQKIKSVLQVIVMVMSGMIAVVWLTGTLIQYRKKQIAK